MSSSTLSTGALDLTGLPARAESQWKKYADNKLEMILAKDPRDDNLQKNIKSSSNSPASRQQQREKAVIEFASGALSRTEAPFQKARLSCRHRGHRLALGNS
jgi:multiple sugar transport system substrate-binding protein